MKVLGIHIGHDSGAAIVSNGEIIAAVNEERFNRIKHYAGLPTESVLYCLRAGGIEFEGLDAVAVASSPHDPYLHAFFQLDNARIRRLSVGSFQIKELKDLRSKILKYLNRRYAIAGGLPLHVKTFPISKNTHIEKVDHHLCHAASAYYTSGYDNRTLIITADGEGDGVSIGVWIGENGSLRLLRSYGENASLGWFYGSVTEALGWWVGDGEGKTMGLAPYGNPDKFDDRELLVIMPRFEAGRVIKTHNFGHNPPLRIKDTLQWHIPDSKYIRTLVEKYSPENVAAKAQKLLENEMVHFIKFWVRKERANHLATAGGLFLNVKLNQRIIESEIVENYHVFPNAGDAGLALGAALFINYLKTSANPGRLINNVYWGPEYKTHEIHRILMERNLPAIKSPEISREAARYLAQGKIVAWFQGRMEYGPRALGNRSILFDPRRAENKDIINAKVKFREPFRPFCPSLTAEAASHYLNTNRADRYMIIACQAIGSIVDKIPAVVHIDGSCRPQVVTKEDNPLFWELIDYFGKLTGTPVVLNTSFNIKEEPIVCTPRDAIKCFYDSGLDVLVMDNYIIEKG